jgi:hypothetical protein
MRRTSAALLPVLLLAGGCQESGESFAEAYNQAAQPLTELRAEVGTKPAEFRRLARRTELTRSNLARLDPPDDARDELDRLLRGLREATRDLRAVAIAARSANVAEQRQAARRLVRSSTEVQRAEAALQRAVND